MSTGVRFVTLSQIPFRFGNYIPKPSYYDNLIVITTNDNESRSIPGIYQYNMAKNEMNTIKKYKRNFGAFRHGQFIIPQHNILVIFGGTGCRQQFSYSFNLNTKTVAKNLYNELNIFSKLTEYIRTIYVPLPIYPQIHCMDEKGNHYKYQITDKSVYKMRSNLPYIRHPKLLLVESKSISNHKQYLMIFGGNNYDTIYFSDCLKKSSYIDHCDWHKSALKMPYTVNWCHYDIILGFKNIVFVFYFPFNTYYDRDVWCFDILFNKWHKTNYQIPMNINAVNNIYALKSENNFVNVICFRSGNNIKANLFDMLPTDLKREHQNYYAPLIMAYIEQMERKKIIQSVPFELKKLISLFFPSFI